MLTKAITYTNYNGEKRTKNFYFNLTATELAKMEIVEKAGLEETIKQIALMCKQTGTDIHHIGDSGHPGIAAPRNIMAYSISIRGIRHTYHRMAASARR